MQKPIYSLFIFIAVLLAACSMPAVLDRSPASTPSQTTVATPKVFIQDVQGSEPSPATEPTKLPSPTKVIAPKPTHTPIVASQPVDIYPFVLQAGTPTFTSNFIDLEASCDWMGVGGQVFDRNDKPVTGLVAEVGGSLEDKVILSLALTGGSTILGPGGYVVKLTDQPIASENTLWIQLFDLGGAPLSEKIYFSTFADSAKCEKNLVIINFRELGSQNLEYYFPSIFKNGK